MTLLDAVFYFLTAFYVLPHKRNEVPFKRMGFDLTQMMEIATEAGLYEAGMFEAFKSVACFLDKEYSTDQGWCSVTQANFIETVSNNLALW